MGGLQKFGFRNSNAIFPVSGSYAPFLILGLYAVTRSGVFRRDVSFFWTERRLVLHFPAIHHGRQSYRRVQKLQSGVYKNQTEVEPTWLKGRKPLTRGLWTLRGPMPRHPGRLDLKTPLQTRLRMPPSPRPCTSAIGNVPAPDNCHFDFARLLRGSALTRLLPAAPPAPQCPMLPLLPRPSHTLGFPPLATLLCRVKFTPANKSPTNCFLCFRWNASAVAHRGL